MQGKSRKQPRTKNSCLSAKLRTAGGVAQGVGVQSYCEISLVFAGEALAWGARLFNFGEGLVRTVWKGREPQTE